MGVRRGVGTGRQSITKYDERECVGLTQVLRNIFSRKCKKKVRRRRRKKRAYGFKFNYNNIILAKQLLIPELLTFFF